MLAISPANKASNAAAIHLMIVVMFSPDSANAASSLKT
jgi:hypothetical protein